MPTYTKYPLPATASVAGTMTTVAKTTEAMTTEAMTTEAMTTAVGTTHGNVTDSGGGKINPTSLNTTIPTTTMKPTSPSTTKLTMKPTTTTMVPTTTTKAPTTTMAPTTTTTITVAPTTGAAVTSSATTLLPLVTTAASASTGPSAMDLVLYIAIPVGIVVLLLVILLIVCLVKRRKKRKNKNSKAVEDTESWGWNDQRPKASKTSPFNNNIGGNKAGKYKALYEYTNDDPENLDLSPGDVVDVTETPNTGWWKGRVGTREGWFPASYVQEISATGLSNPGYSDDTDGAIPTVASGTSTFKGRKTKAQRKAAAEVVATAAEVVAAEAVTPPAAQSTPKDVAPPIEDKKAIMRRKRQSRVFQKYVAIYDYAPGGADELGIKEGETLYFMEEDVNGWIKGKKETTEEHGWFPASYVEKVKENKNAKKPSAVPDNPYQQLDHNDATDDEQGEYTGIEHMALYDYVADRSEGLSFRKGETIAVIEVQDQGWWCGCAGNQLGWFPASYVEIIPYSPSTLPDPGEYTELKNSGPAPLPSIYTSLSPSPGGSTEPLADREYLEVLPAPSQQGSQYIHPGPRSPASNSKMLNPASPASPTSPTSPSEQPVSTEGVVRRNKLDISGPVQLVSTTADLNKMKRKTIIQLEREEAKSNAEKAVERSPPAVDVAKTGVPPGGTNGVKREKPQVPRRWVTPKLVSIPRQSVINRNSRFVFPDAPPPLSPSTDGELSPSDLTPRSAPPEKPPPRPSSHKPALSPKAEEVGQGARPHITSPSLQDQLKNQLNAMNKKPKKHHGRHVNPSLGIPPNPDPPIFATSTDRCLEAPSDGDASSANTKSPPERPLSDKPVLAVRPNVKRGSENLEENYDRQSDTVLRAKSPVKKSPPRLSPKRNLGSPPATPVRSPVAPPIGGNTGGANPPSSPRRPMPEPPAESIQLQQVPPGGYKKNKKPPADDSVFDDSLSHTPVKRRPQSPTKRLSLKRSSSNYDAQFEGELSFEEGDVIKELSKVKDRPGWSYGIKSDGSTGIYPSRMTEDLTLQASEV